ncbi:MAG: ATP-binding protein [Gammaproteobacteria bacterium]|nr:ATP-binding protein [Gammaproteobacteria bacterium]
MIHMICGPVGSGKTTIAHRLADEHGAICFSEDEWLNTLFFADVRPGLMDEPSEQIAQWAVERYLRCRVQIWLLCEQLLTQGGQVILDGGLSTKEQRDMLKAKAVTRGFPYQLYYVDSDHHIRKNRVIKRNLEKPKTFSIEVTSELFDLLEECFEPPVDEELINAIVIKT